MSSHIILILLYTALSILHYNVKATNGDNGNPVLLSKVIVAWTFVGGIADLFITCMLWFILDGKTTPDMFS